MHQCTQYLVDHRTPITGFTALELLVTIAIVGILASLAIPALQDFSLNNRAIGYINEFAAAVDFARNEAIKRGTPVTLCASTAPQAAGPTCDGRKRWETGWILFADHDRDARPDVGAGACLTEEDCLLRVWDGSNAMTLRAGRTRITFDSLGAARGFNATWQLCDERGAAAARAVILSAGGRLRRAEDTDGNGIPNGGTTDITCPSIP